MRTNKYMNIKRWAVTLFLGATMLGEVSAQEALHLFYKNGNRETIEISPDTKVEFYKKPYCIAYYNNQADTIHLSASAGRSFGLGFVEYNTDWEIEAKDSWLLALKGDNEWKQGQGMLNDYFVLFALSNESDAARYGKVTLTSKRAGYSREFTVVQHPYMLSLESQEPQGNWDNPVVADSVSLNWNDSVYYKALYPNHGVKVLSHPDWMKLDYIHNPGPDYTFDSIMKVPSPQAAGNGTTVAAFKVEQNDTPDDRTGNIVFEGKGQSAVLTVTQRGLNEATIIYEAKLLAKKMYLFGANGDDDRHNDIGFPELMLATDSRGVDLVSEYAGYNWFTGQVEFTDYHSNYYYTYHYWNTLYNTVKASNSIIKEYGGRSNGSMFQFLLAQAYTFRAFNYFYLAQLYQHTYVGNEDKPCVPIVTEENMNTVYTDGCPRASVRDVYGFILADLTKAAELFEKTTFKPAGKQFANVAVVHALRARIYMVMNMWQEAAADAQHAIELSGAVPYSMSEVARPAFDDINHSAWIWGIDTEESDNCVISGICNFPSHMGSLCYGYASVGVWRRINKKLFEAIPDSDVRKGWWLNSQGYSANLNTKQADYVASAGCAPYTQMKFAPYQNVLGQSVNANDIPLIRVEEMWLILSEAKAMAGDAAAGVATLENFVNVYRNPSYKCYATSPAEVQEAVWLQRRIELWGEGHSYFDLMRLKKGIDRRGAGFEPGFIYDIPAGDNILIYPIPDSEMNKNMMLQQNPEATSPTIVTE